MRSPLNLSQNDRPIYYKKKSANRSEPIAVSQRLHQPTAHQPTQRLLHFREKEKTTPNLVMQLLVGGTTLIVSVGV
ncbi:hypothetical protein QUA54_14695 [Microcoleus sp. MOSTC5]|uniref:hypothetical protein n=1 Tax=Microcoleus sp. MOSTC5 TaxID=3055378 RepID=UPI002FD1A805